MTGWAAEACGRRVLAIFVRHERLLRLRPAAVDLEVARALVNGGGALVGIPAGVKFATSDFPPCVANEILDVLAARLTAGSSPSP